MMHTCQTWTRVGVMKSTLVVILILVSCQYLLNMLVFKNSVLILNIFNSSYRNMFNTSSEHILRSLVTTARPLDVCPFIPPKLRGRNVVNTEVPAWVSLQEKFSMLSPGGRYKPTDCLSRNRVAIIIPYRDREIHLKIFLSNIHPVLQRQQLDYGIFVVEMAANISFNRALLMNIGYAEAIKQYDYDCFIFHDVDLLPEDDRNLYACPSSPRHMSVAIDRLNYALPYAQLFGGVSALSRHDFEKINGFSNLYFGWGGEDDDMYRRILWGKLTVTRYSPQIARYKMLVHAKDKGNPGRWSLLRNSKNRRSQDGINSLNYTVIKLELKRLYTWVLVSVNETQMMDGELVPKLLAVPVAPKQNKTVVKQTKQSNVVQGQDRERGGNATDTKNNTVLQKPRVKRVKYKPPTVISWIPEGFKGNIPANLTKIDPLPVKPPSPAQLKRRQEELAALRARKRKLSLVVGKLVQTVSLPKEQKTQHMNPPQSDNSPQSVHPQPQNIQPQPQNVHPQPQNGHPQPQNGHPQPQNVHPQSQNGLFLSYKVHLQPQNVHPQPKNVDSQSQHQIQYIHAVRENQKSPNDNHTLS